MSSVTSTVGLLLGVVQDDRLRNEHHRNADDGNDQKSELELTLLFAFGVTEQRNKLLVFIAFLVDCTTGILNYSYSQSLMHGLTNSPAPRRNLMKMLMMLGAWSVVGSPAMPQGVAHLMKIRTTMYPKVEHRKRT